jgi:cytochrome c-type biogenesis protein CcmE
VALTGPPAAPSAATSAATSAVPPAPPALRRRRALLDNRRRQIVAAAIVAGAISFLLVEGLGNATEYYKTVPQAVDARASLGTSQFRIMGTVDNDIRQIGSSTEFSISYSGVTARVVDSREPPQLFKSGVPVVLEGHWSGAIFQSDLIMVKHTAIYNPAERAVMSTMPGNDTPPAPAPSSK